MFESSAFRPGVRRAGAMAIIRAFVICVCTASLHFASAASSPASTIVRFDTNFGIFDVELFDDVVPTTVGNFLDYVTGGRYENTLVHRTTQLPTVGIGIIQGGGYDLAFDPIATDPPIALEYVLPNARGTLSMARTAVQNSATSQWFINTTDNSAILGPSNGGGYAVFGQVLGNGMDVVDAINALPTYAAGPFPSQVPLDDYTQGVDDPLDHTVVINSITVVPEPATSVLFASGVIIAAVSLRRRRSRSSRL